MEQLGRDMASREMKRLFPQLQQFAEVTQIMPDRFA